MFFNSHLYSPYLVNIIMFLVSIFSISGILSKIISDQINKQFSVGNFSFIEFKVLADPLVLSVIIKLTFNSFILIYSFVIFSYLLLITKNIL